MSELAVINKAEMNELSAILGTSDRPTTDRLPQLKVNTKRKDAQGNKIEQGKFMLTELDEPVYADHVWVRVLSQLFQWIHYDPEENKVVNKTLLIPNFRHEARDMKGTIRCGKPASKVLKEMSKEEQKKYVDIKCFRQLRVLVTMTGKTASGEEVTIENQPAIILLKGSNFNPFEDEYIKSLPKGKDFHDFWCKVTAEELENGSVVYYVMHFEGDFKEPVSLDQQTYDTMIHFAKLVKQENDRVESAHQGALRNGAEVDDALEAIEGDLSDDFDDE